MRLILRSAFIVFAILVCTYLRSANAPESHKELSASELLALVAGQSLPESIVLDIQSRGLAFKPREGYRALLVDAGADARVLAAFDKAAPGTASDTTQTEYLRHLATAGKLLRSKDYDSAARELTDALQTGDDTSAAFVMGTVLADQERYPMASSVYAEIVERDPDFPEVHTKYSFALYKCQDSDESLRQVKAALAESPENAEAHKNAGNALLMARKYDAAVAEFNEALRIKPDYASVRFNIGYTYFFKGDFDPAIVELRKAIALDPNLWDPHYFLGATFEKKQQFQEAIPEFREAKRLEPNRFEIRMNLGNAFYESGMYAEALQEFRTLIALFPDNAIAHKALGNAYLMTGNQATAETEYRTSIELDPSDWETFLRLGNLLENQAKLDEALEAYQRGAKLNEKSAEARRDIAQILVVKKDYVGALRELRWAEEINPGDAETHDLYGRTLQASGQQDLAIDEFRQAATLDPENAQLQIQLATALENKGDWVAALGCYRKAAVSDAGKSMAPRIIHKNDRDPQKEYKGAQARFQQNLSSLKANGKSAEADKLASAVAASRADTSLSAKLDAAMQAGFAALREGRANDALQNYKEAVQIGEQMKVQDDRLAVALGELGRITLGLKRFDEADAIFQQQLKTVQQAAGPQSSAMIEPLENLGMNAMYQQRYDLSRTYLTRSLELAKQNYGEKNSAVAAGLLKIGMTYLVQGDYTNAEAWLLRAVRIDEEIGGYDGFQGVADLTTLCTVYDRASKSDRAADCYAKLVGIGEKRFGPNNSLLAQPLASEANALRALGRNDEAATIEQRIKKLQASTSN